jgi:hypothetical protein
VSVHCSSRKPRPCATAVRICAHPTGRFHADLCGEQRAKSSAQKSKFFLADFDPAFVQKILRILKQKREPAYSITARRTISGDILNYRKALCYVIRNRYLTAPDKVPSDSAVWVDETFARLARRTLESFSIA